MDDQKVKKPRKPRGMRKDNRIQVSYTDGKKPDGSPNRLWFYGRTRAEAEAARDQYKEFKKAGLSYSDRKMTLNEWVDRWIALYKVDVDDYGPYIKRLRTDLGKLELRGIREGELVESLAKYAGKSKSGATKYRMIVKQVFHRAYRNHLILDDPAEDLELPEVTEGTHRALERWEIDCIMDHWREYPAGRWAMLMLFCGLRRGEMIALDWSAVDMEEKTVTVNAAASFKKNEKTIKDHTKTDAGMRTLPISSPLYEMLSETPEKDRVGCVCLSAGGKPISKDTVRKNWSTYCRAMTNILNGRPALQPGNHRKEMAAKEAAAAKAHGLDPAPENEIIFDCDMHDLRHTYATMLFEAGIEAKDAQYYLGHADLRMTTELYTHLTEERKKKTLAKVTGYLDSWLNPDSPDGEKGASK